MGCLASRCGRAIANEAGLRGASQPIEPDPGHAGGVEMQAPQAELPEIARPTSSSAFAPSARASIASPMRWRKPSPPTCRLAAGAMPSMTIAAEEVVRRLRRSASLRCWSTSAP